MESKSDLATDRLDPIAAQLGNDPRLGEYAIAKRRWGYIELTRRDRAILLCEPALLHRDPRRLQQAFERVAALEAAIVMVGDTEEAPELAQLLARGVYDVLPVDASSMRLYLSLRNAWEHLEVRSRQEARVKQLRRYRHELGELVEIARALTSERDLGRLLSIILEKSRNITGADAGSIYVVEGTNPDILERTLHFKLSQNDSVVFEGAEFRMPISTTSIAGAAAVARKFIAVEDVYKLDKSSEFTFDKSFDEKVGYRTKSMLVAPLISHSDEVIGVIQLINKKRDPDRTLDSPEDAESMVIPFDDRSAELLATLAAQAGISLENAILYEEIRRIFEGFVKASVHAIEQRDPTTSGHSERVSVLSVELAKTVDRASDGPYADQKFSPGEINELEYAALLHDFGKVGVREQVLVKSKKLYDHQLTLIRARFDYIARTIEVDTARRKMEAIERGASAASLTELDAAMAQRRLDLDACWRLVVESNEPTVLKAGEFGRIQEMAQLRYLDLDGAERPYLTTEEATCLGIQRGSLTPAERDEIQSHVRHTFTFLSQIPWGKSFSNVPRIAGAHHEKLNGTGYPWQLPAEQIPVQSKIMSIVDIYDALTASDRPYKKAVPSDKALDILGFEVKDGHLDADLVKIFRDGAVYRIVEGPLTH